MKNKNIAWQSTKPKVNQYTIPSNTMDAVRTSWIGSLSQGPREEFHNARRANPKSSQINMALRPRWEIHEGISIAHSTTSGSPMIISSPRLQPWTPTKTMTLPSTPRAARFDPGKATKCPPAPNVLIGRYPEIIDRPPATYGGLPTMEEMGMEMG